MSPAIVGFLLTGIKYAETVYSSCWEGAEMLRQEMGIVLRKIRAKYRRYDA
jgi:hypothetical protein